ncbi:MAG: YceD family protein [Candidatus Geothermincolia bacterium]
MRDMQPSQELYVDVSAALPSVGDRKKVEGGAEVVVREGYEMRFDPGGSVQWTLELRRIAGAVEIAGVVSGTVTLLCFRCLEEFAFPLAIDMREHALWLSGGPGEESEETATDYVVMDGMLDLEPVLRDAIALAFPVRRVCTAECKGLCVKCGANRNLEECGCDTRPVDVRLSPLADLKKRLEQKEA